MIAVAVLADPKGFNCETCPHKHCDESNPAPAAMWQVSDVPGEPNGIFKSRTCLLPMITDRTHYFIKLHAHYKNGHLLNPGGIGDQPNAYLSAMEIIDRASVSE